MIRALILMTGTLSMTAPAFAETDADLSESIGADTSIALDDVVVSATRTERPRFSTPAATSVVRRDEIQRVQPYAYQDLFEAIPGVNVLGGPRRIAEEPAIRGFADEQVVIRLDGARQNFNKAHGGRFFVDPDLLASVEVLRGAGSAIYGSGALGGVFVLETLSGRDLTGGVDGLGFRQKIGWQSNGDEWASYTTGYAQSGAFDVLGNYIVRDVGEDLQTGAGEDLLATRDRIDNGMAKFGWEPGEHQRLELTVDRFENSGRNPTNANAIATPTNIVDRDTERSGARLRYRLDDPANRWWNIDATLYRNDVESREFRLDDQRVDETDFRTRGLELVNTSRLGGTDDRPLRLTWGIEAYSDEQDGTRNGDDREQFPDAEVDYRAAFVQAELPLGGGLSLIPGLRFDAFEYDARAGFANRDDDELTPRIALGWEPVENLYFWGEYAEAFRAPSLTELYADGVHFVVPLGPGQVVINEFVPTPDLEAEHAEQLQVGARWRAEGLFGRNLALEIDAVAYRSDVDDFVDQFVVFIAGEPRFDPVTRQLVFPGITTNRNVDAEIEGAELELRLAGSRGYLQGSLTAIDGQGDNGTDLASVQADRAVLGGGLYFADRRVTLGARLVAAADRRDVPEGALATPGYGKTDVFVEYLPGSGRLDGFEFRLAVDNLFDKDFRIHPNGVDEPGRTVRLSIAYEANWLR